jgi:hypothetical protein
MNLLFVIWLTAYAYYLAETWPGNEQSERPEPTGQPPPLLPEFTRERNEHEAEEGTVTEWEEIHYSK